MPAFWKVIVVIEAIFNIFGGLYMAIKPLDVLKPLVNPNAATMLGFGAEIYRLFGMMIALQGMSFIRCRNSRSLAQLLQLAFIGDLVYLYLLYRFVDLYGDITDIGAQSSFILTGFFTIARIYTMFAAWRAFSGAAKPKLA